MFSQRNNPYCDLLSNGLFGMLPENCRDLFGSFCQLVDQMRDL